MTGPPFRGPLPLGCIADDFTGATDLGNTLTREGVRVVQVMGVPPPGWVPPDADALVVALKTRTAPVDEAVTTSLAALERLRGHGVDRVFFKYCSTFDSRPDGNIGPVADAIMDALGCSLTVVCPAFPETGRTVYRGHLFVGREPLAESPMAEHPLTPMRDSSVPRLLAAQVRRSVTLADYDTVRQGPRAIGAALEKAALEGHGYVVLDALSDRHVRDIGAASAGLALITGASGVARGLPDALRARGALPPPTPPGSFELDTGLTAVLAGSVSESTRAQLQDLAGASDPVTFDPMEVAGSEDARDKVLTRLLDRLPSVAVLHPRNSPEEVRRAQDAIGRDGSARIVEDVMAAAAARLAERGVRRFIVAGGETSAAVVEALGIDELLIGPQIAPGVPWCRSTGQPTFSLTLKSGNFGGPRFFRDALAALA